MATTPASDVPRRVVVVGGGVAGCRCVFELRRLGFDGAATLVSAEEHPPYDRTELSKEMLGLDATPREPTALRAASHYADHDIELRLGVPVEAIDTAARRVRLSTGDELPYDRLVVCTGGSPIWPRSLAAPGVLTLREAEDAVRLRAQLERCRRVAVIGGGFIGGEIASAARALGIDVTLVEAAGAPLVPVLGAEVGERIAELHRGAGVRLRCGAAARSIVTRGRSYEVVLDDGTTVDADAVVVGVGMRPRVDWLEPWLRVDGGLVTDAYCQTDAPGVLAAGDCARWWHAGYRTMARVEHWDTAARHGVAAARAALGGAEPFSPLPFFWSDQHGVKLQWVGYAPQWDRVDVSEGSAAHSFTARYYRDGRLMGVFAAAQPREIAGARLQLRDDLETAVDAELSIGLGA